MSDVPNRLREVIEAHYKRVRLRFAFLLNDAVAAEDLTQEVFARFWEVCLKQGEPQDASAFIRGVERLVFLEHLRSKKKQARMSQGGLESVPDGAGMPAETAEHGDTLHMLRHLLGMLDPEDQWLIAGRHFYELTGDELSRLSGVPRRTLLDRYSRAMERLRLLAVQHGLGL